MATEIPSESVAPVETETPRTAEGLRELITNANLQYSLKNYDGASEIYSEAAELQGELNGELAPENAELLYFYGRCLFKVALAKSDLLGGQLVGEDGRAAAMEKQLKATVEEDAKKAARSLMMQINGDEEDEEEDEDEDGEAEEEEDEFQNAHDILELARVCYEKQLEDTKANPIDESSEGEKGKGAASIEPTSAVKLITERLADTHDLLAEIALENEDFTEAASESRSTLQLRQGINPVESGLIAEGHFKLALALEFAFNKAVNDAKNAKEEGGPAAIEAGKAIDVKMLYQAVENVAFAIQSCEKRIAAEQAGLSSLSEEAAVTKKKDIQDVEEMVQELKVKLADVGNTAKSATVDKDLSTHLSPAIIAELEKASGLLPSADMTSVSLFDEQEAITGTAAQKPGETKSERQERIDQVSAKANDLSGLVRKKKPETSADTTMTGTNGKRKADEGTESSGGEGKKVKFDL